MLPTWLVLALVLPVCAGDSPEERAEVRIGGQMVFVLKARDAKGHSPAERALLVEHRLDRVLADLTTGPEEIVAEGPRILIAGAVLLEVGDGDAGIEGLDREALAAAWAERVRTAFSQTKYRRVTLRLVTKYLVSLLFPLLLLGVLVGLARLRRAMVRSIAKAEDKRPSPLRIGQFEVVSMPTLKGALKAAVTGTAVALGMVSIYVFVHGALYYFPATQGAALKLAAILGGGLRAFREVVSGPLSAMAGIVVVTLACYMILRSADEFFDAVAAGRVRFGQYLTRDNADTMEYLVKGITVLMAVLAVLLLLPKRWTTMGAAVLLLFGAATAFAAVGVLRNVVAGFVLAFLTSYRRGARIRIDDEEATILRRGVLFSVLQLSDGNTAMVPNNELLSRPVYPKDPDTTWWWGRVALSENAKVSALQMELEKWASQYGNDARIRLLEIVDGTLRFELQVSSLLASDDVFLAAASDGLNQELASGSLLSLGPRP